MVEGLEPELFGIRPEMVALDLDARPWLDRKRGALAAHRSQFGLTIENMAAPPPGRPAAVLAAFTPLLERETYLLGGARTATPRWPLADAFEVATGVLLLGGEHLLVGFDGHGVFWPGSTAEMRVLYDASERDRQSALFRQLRRQGQ